MPGAAATSGICAAVLPLDKWKWHPSPLAGQIVYVLTSSASGELDLAPKSWVQMAGFNGPLLSLGCSKHHWTHNDIMTTGHYTVSFPTVEQTRCAGAIARTPRAERVAASGLTPVPSSTAGIPHLRECPAYCECELYREVVATAEQAGGTPQTAVPDGCVPLCAHVPGTLVQLQVPVGELVAAGQRIGGRVVAPLHQIAPAIGEPPRRLRRHFRRTVGRLDVEARHEFGPCRGETSREPACRAAARDRADRKSVV